MANTAKVPADPLAFIQNCVRAGQMLWTYHVGMRLKHRSITRDEIIAAIDTYEVIEAYPDDKYLPSYLVLASKDGDTLHILFATDVDGSMAGS